MRSSARLTGCRPPVPRLRPGSVTSSACAASCALELALRRARRGARRAPPRCACLAALISAPRAFFSSARQRAERLQLLGDAAGLAEEARLGVLELGRRRARGEVGLRAVDHRSRSFIVGATKAVTAGDGLGACGRGRRLAAPAGEIRTGAAFTFSTMLPKAAGSLTAMSARTLRSMSICGLLQAGHELAVGDAEAAGRGVDARDPELAEDALLGAAVAIGVLPGAHDRFLGDAEDVLAAAAEALGEGEDLLVAGTCGDTTFDARHGCSPSKLSEVEAIRGRRTAASAPCGPCSSRAP